MKDEFISIIVPIYNSEQYLEKCINSIVNQTYKKLEIILVDDGSTDSSGKICDEYAQNDNRIRVIHKKNGGLQEARSVGITAAKGVFIGFVDSDDWVDADMYESLYRSIGLADLATSGLWHYDISGARNKVVDALEAGIYDGQSEYFCENLNIKYAEDLLLTIAYALRCKKIVVTHDCYYHYRYTPSSMCRSKNLNYLEEMNRFYRVLDRAIMEHVFEKTLRDQLNRLLLYFVYTYTSSMMQMGAELYYPQYVFPQNKLLAGKRVVLFGSGKVGKSYYRNWKYNDSIQVVQWIDSAPLAENFLGKKVDKAEEIIQDGYDYVVCAVLDQERAEGMKKQLISYGIREDVILWEKPNNIFREFCLVR